MIDTTPQPPIRARLASGYLTVLQRHARRDPEGVRTVHAYVDFLRSELRTARQALAERDDPTLAGDEPPVESAPWATRAAQLLAEQQRQQRARTWLPKPDAAGPTAGIGR